jgi:hypothetical protein
MINMTEEKLRAEIARLMAVKRRALQLADERAKEAAALRLENAQLRPQLAAGS